MTVLDLHEVTRVFRQGQAEVVALDRVSLSVEAGELVAVMGPSGSGKSTLLTLAGGLDEPTAGTVRVRGSDLAGMSRTEAARVRRQTIGFVFQDLNLVPALTAAENVALPLELDGIPVGQARRQALAVLDELGMEGLAHRFPDDLSGGEQQRVAVARAMVGERILLLADEPTGALDTLTGEGVLRLLRAHCDQGGAGMMVTHDAAQAAWADRVVFLRDGRIVDQAGPVDGPERLLAGEARA